MKLQKKLNEGIVKQMKKYGDNLNDSHDIDYFFYFSSGENREDFIKEITKSKEFKFSNYHDYFEQKDDKPYGVVISQFSNIDLEIMNKLTSRFVYTAIEYDGIFDGWETQVKRKE